MLKASTTSMNRAASCRFSISGKTVFSSRAYKNIGSYLNMLPILQNGNVILEV